MIAKKKDKIFLYQIDLIKKLEKEFEEELSEVKGVDSPAISGEGIVTAKEDERIKIHTKYRSAHFFWSNIQDQTLAMLLGTFEIKLRSEPSSLQEMIEYNNICDQQSKDHYITEFQIWIKMKKNVKSGLMETQIL